MSGETGSGSYDSLPDHYIKICTPYYSDYDDAYKLSLIALSKQSRVKWEHQACKSALIALARNTLVNGQSTLVKQQLDPKYSHYLFVDSDIAFYADDIIRLLKHNFDIVSGAYASRENPNLFQAGMYLAVEGNPGSLINDKSEGLHKVDFAGAGFLLVKRTALETMEYPWFRHCLIRHIEELPGNRLAYHQVETNEDIGFCMVAKAAGFDINLDCNCRVMHVLEADPRPLQLTPVGKSFAAAK